MPQMAPMNWLILFFLFITIFLLFNFLNYFKFMIKNNNNLNKKFSMNFFYWKW